MALIRIKMNRAAVGELLKSEEVRYELHQRAQMIAAAAGEGFEVESRVGATRARASVRTATYEAMRAEAEERALSSAVEAGRG